MRHTVGILVVLLTACGIRAPLRNTIVIEPNEDRHNVTVTARTEFIDPGKDDPEQQRLTELRNTILEGRDPWTARFATVTAESERVFWEKEHGKLRRAERTAKITIDDLQRLLTDCGTVQITDGERWVELALYPSASVRATRQQREHVEHQMHRMSADVVRYLRALDRVYAYLNKTPDRATPVFTILLSDKEEKSTIEEEDALLTDVNRAMGLVVDHIDEARQQGVTLDEEFDLVFNPLPAEVVVRTPSPILAVEGFDKRDDHTVAIPRAGVVEAIRSLQGRWASPDPLAIIALASDSDTELPKPEDVAAQPRRSTATVTADEVEKVLIARVKPAAAYRVRWGFGER